MSTLVIAEKPDMGAKIANVLMQGQGSKRKGYIEGNGYYVTWAIGHLIGFPPADFYDSKYKTWNLEDLPIIPDPFQLIADPKKMEQIKIIRELAEQSNMIINACDAGREGQYIFERIYRHLRLLHPVKRLWTKSLTENGLKTAFQLLKNNSDYQHLYAAADARAKADWLIGINGTRALSVQHQAKLSIGRVQTPTLAMVYDRALAIENHVKKTRYDVSVTFTQGNEQYTGIREGEEIADREKADRIAEQIQGKQGTIHYYEKEKGKESAPKLFDLATLQTEANKQYGFTLQQTLDTAQKLYEKHESITYPRTDSRFVTDDEIPMMLQVFDAVKPRFLKMEMQGADQAKKEIVSPQCRRVCNPDKVGDHHAILPTENIPAKGQLSETEQQLYVMITRRFFLQFFEPATFMKHKIQTKVGSHYFRTTVKEWVEKGWRQTLQEQDDEEEKENTRNTFSIDPDTAVHLAHAETKERVSQPPKPYTEGTLVKDMEAAGKKLDDEEMKAAIKDTGLGTPATRAAIVERLKNVEYIMEKGKHLTITAKGRSLIELLRQTSIHTLTSAELTGEWEKRLHDIARGYEDPEKMLSGIKPFTSLMVSEIQKMEKQNMQVTEVITSCPCCQQGNIIETQKAFGCDRWKSGCSFKIWKKTYGQKKITKKQCFDLIEKGKTSLLTFYNKENKKYKGRLCLTSISDGRIELEFENKTPKSLGTCPKCGNGEVLDRKKLYGCSNYPNCRFHVFKTLAGKKLQTRIIQQLLSERETEMMEGFISKKGKSFKAYLVLNEQQQVEFRFPNTNINHFY
ncbi:DNA topoisomerase 3 [Salibacterium aidingense]|uniref:DNA topoisomerase 3 n=1 Tax=Salibacterium aidingense TaxID=384933 RepID=UPI00041354F7|nr:DNA topoisomerase 3 [Salibacterium aidingense]